MGADGFVAIYGVKFEVGSADEVDSFCTQWRQTARRARLRIWSGRLTDGSPHYVVVGSLLGDFGVQGHDHQVTVTDSDFSTIASSTREKLKSAGVPGDPALHLLFEAQY